MDATRLAGAAADTDDSSRGLRAVAALRRLLETLELRQVEQALRQGASWSDIAADLVGFRRGNRTPGGPGTGRSMLRRSRCTASAGVDLPGLRRAVAE